MSGLLFGADRQELKKRMERIIEAEEQTVKTIKIEIQTMEKLIETINAHKEVMERMLKKL